MYVCMYYVENSGACVNGDKINLLIKKGLLVQKRENEEVNFLTRKRGMRFGASVGGLTSRKETFLPGEREGDRREDRGDR